MLKTWSEWDWSNTEQSCGEGSRNRGFTPAIHEGQSCEAQFGLNFSIESKAEPCPGIIY